MTSIAAHRMSGPAAADWDNYVVTIGCRLATGSVPVSLALPGDPDLRNSPETQAPKLGRCPRRTPHPAEFVTKHRDQGADLHGFSSGIRESKTTPVRALQSLRGS